MRDYLEIIQKSLIYIEDNLKCDLSLDILAKQAFLSPYYYHKLFHTFIGISVMEHVRKRRLAVATTKLLNSDDDITNIAMEYQFNSLDVFIRVFKRYYGISPRKYRAINKKNLNCITPINQKGGDKMINFELGKRLILSNAEKNNCFDTLKLILELSEKAHKNGLLALQNEIYESHSFFLKKSLQFLVDGAEPKFIRTTLYNYISCCNYSGCELLERLIITEGILSIQAGEQTSFIYERLCSYFGEEFSQQMDDFYEQNKVLNDTDLFSYIDSIKDKAPLSQSTSLLEAPIQKMDTRSLQRLIREIEIEDLFNALKGASGKTVERILQSTSKKLVKLLIDELSSDKHPSPHQIIKSQNTILSIMIALRASNDIQ